MSNDKLIKIYEEIIQDLWYGFGTDGVSFDEWKEMEIKLKELGFNTEF